MRYLQWVFWRWLPFAAAGTALTGLIYLTVQQVWRQSANDPQIQLARDAAEAISAGAAPQTVLPATSVDYSRSLAPFVMILSDSGDVVASSGHLAGEVRPIPA